MPAACCIQTLFQPVIPGSLLSCISPFSHQASQLLPAACCLRYSDIIPARHSQVPVFLHFSLQPPGQFFLVSAACGIRALSGFLFSCIQPSAAWPVFPCVCRLRYTGTFRLPVFLHFSLQPPASRFLLPAACCKQTLFQPVIPGSPFSCIQPSAAWPVFPCVCLLRYTGTIPIWHFRLPVFLHFSLQPSASRFLLPAVNRLSASP